MNSTLHIGLSLLLTASVTFTGASCGGGDKKVEDASDQPRREEEEPTEEEINAMMAETGLQFDEEAATIVLKRGARKVGDCAKEGAVSGEGEITAIFDGPKGRIVDVDLGYTFNDGSERGKACIKNAFIGEIIPPFEGKKEMPWKIKIDDAPAEGGGKKR